MEENHARKLKFTAWVVRQLLKSVTKSDSTGCFETWNAVACDTDYLKGNVVPFKQNYSSWNNSRCRLAEFEAPAQGTPLDPIITSCSRNCLSQTDVLGHIKCSKSPLFPSFLHFVARTRSLSLHTVSICRKSRCVRYMMEFLIQVESNGEPLLCHKPVTEGGRKYLAWHWKGNMNTQL
jgi:hypothetical protein